MVCFLFHFDLVKKDLIDNKNIEETNCREELKDQNNWHFRCCDWKLFGLKSLLYALLLFNIFEILFSSSPLISYHATPKHTICICLNNRNFREFLSNLTLHVYTVKIIIRVELYICHSVPCIVFQTGSFSKLVLNWVKLLCNSDSLSNGSTRILQFTVYSWEIPTLLCNFWFNCYKVPWWIWYNFMI